MVTLPNGLPMLHIHMPESSRVAAAVSISAGHFDDPAEYPGLTHLLEHMLFQGTETFPSDKFDFSQMLARCGGKANAWTNSEFMTFFYDAHLSTLNSTLEQFSQFFICPEFSLQKLQKEVISIDAEFKLKVRDELRRLNEVHKETCNPEHAFSRFSVGNKQTFLQNDITELQSALKQHFLNCFTTDKIKLVIASPQPCSEITQLASEYFSSIKSKTSENKIKVNLYRPQDLAVQIQVKQ